MHKICVLTLPIQIHFTWLKLLLISEWQKKSFNVSLLKKERNEHSKTLSMELHFRSIRWSPGADGKSSLSYITTD